MTEQERTQFEKQRKANRFRELNKSALPNQIVCAGSSLMEMFPVEEFIKEYKKPLIIYNRGIGGYVAKELLYNLDVCILNLQPSRLFINIGTNDLSNSAVTIAGLMNDYDAILSKVKANLPKTEIYIMAYFPINYEAAAANMKECLKIRTNQRINEANTALQILAKKHSARYIDINDNLKDAFGRLKAEYTIEGMHINKEGYRAIFEDFVKYAEEPKWVK